MPRNDLDPRERLSRLCSECGNCCHEPVAPVTDADVRRIVASTGRPAASFVRMYGTSEVEFDPDELGVVRLAYGERFMGLKKRARRCVFLDSRNRCTVYGARPMTCRTFPFDVDLDDDGGIARVRMIRCVECAFTRKDARHVPDLAAWERREDREDAAYQRKVDRWNREVEATGRRATKADYLAYLGL